MNVMKLKWREHGFKIGEAPGRIEPNVNEDTLFVDNGEVVGFYIKDISKYSVKASKLADLADVELRSKNVPKKMMNRSSSFKEFYDKKNSSSGDKGVQQYSTILGGTPPRPHMRRPYPSMCSVHSVKSAQKFIKAMYMLAVESEKIIKKIAPDIYEQQKKIFDEEVHPDWKFGNLFTSSISNVNIPATFHRDNGNIKGCVNVIIAKKRNAVGGNTTVPEYGITVNSSDNSMLVYPAWKSLHAVTPIEPTSPNGYRNSLVFYPLKAFLKKNLE
jgi:hypothetical protein